MSLRVAMIAPHRERCGISEATRGLVNALQRHVTVAHYVPPEQFAPDMNDVDLIHVQHQYFLFGGVAPWKANFHRIARAFRRPVVLTAHEIVVPQGSLPRKLAVRLSNRLHFGCRALRRVLVHTQLDARRILHAGVAEPLVRVVRLGVPALPGLPGREEARQALGLERHIVGLMPGFLSRRKGHETAIQAYRALGPAHLLVIAGGRHPDDHSDYPEHIARLAQAQANVRLTGYLTRESLYTHLAAADVVLAPFAESSGSASLALAFAAGLPVIASDIPPHREIVDLVSNALFLVSEHGPAALAAAVERVTDDAVLRESLALGAAQYALACSYECQARETVAIYREVLEGHP